MHARRRCVYRAGASHGLDHAGAVTKVHRGLPCRLSLSCSDSVLYRSQLCGLYCWVHFRQVDL